jgi:hypothetical protein
VCHGAGGWQQHDGAIEECPRGCMTDGAWGVVPVITVTGNPCAASVERAREVRAAAALAPVVRRLVLEAAHEEALREEQRRAWSSHAKAVGAWAAALGFRLTGWQEHLLGRLYAPRPIDAESFAEQCHRQATAPEFRRAYLNEFIQYDPTTQESTDRV